MNVGVLIIQVFALIFLILASFNLFPPPNRPIWGWLGMALWLFSLMVGDFTLHAAR
jgi:hypothetical protein